MFRHRVVNVKRAVKPASSVTDPIGIVIALRVSAARETLAAAPHGDGSVVDRATRA